LTPRERVVLQLLAEGRDIRSISHELQISVNTGRGYVKTLLMKLDAHSQLEAVVIAGMHGLIDAPTRR
jgi:DNA-binding NarL/FixJ family response regulator